MTEESWKETPEGRAWAKTLRRRRTVQNRIKRTLKGFLAWREQLKKGNQHEN